MGTRFQRSINLGHGLRLNISKGGVGLSIGRPGMRFGIHSSGRRHMSLGVPGTGMSYRRQWAGRRGNRPATTPQGLRPFACLRGKFFAPRLDREFVRGLLRLATDDGPEAFRVALENFERAARTAKIKGKKTSSPQFFAGFCAAPSDPAKAIDYLQAVLAADVPLPDRLQVRYIVEPTVPIQITSGVTATVPVSRLAAALLLAELLQAKGDAASAMAALEGFREGPDAQDHALVASLAELYCVVGRHDDAIQITDGFHNDDDLTCQMLVLRARALAATGAHETAVSALKEALKSQKRAEGVRMAALYERGLIYEAMGDAKRARKDFQAIACIDVDYADVATRHRAPAPAEPTGSEPRGFEPLALPPGMRVRAMRRRAGLTQKELADRTGIDQGTICNIETGTSRPRPSTIARLLSALEIASSEEESPAASLSAAEQTPDATEADPPTSDSQGEDR